MLKAKKWSIKESESYYNEQRGQVQEQLLIVPTSITYLIFFYQVPLGGVIDLKFRGCRMLEGVHRRSYVYELCEVHWGCAAAVRTGRM